MAEMWRELSVEYRIKITDLGVDGTKVYLRDDVNGDVAPENLPVVGTTELVNELLGTPAVVPNCICRDMEGTFIQGHGGTPAWRCSFSTQPSGSQSSPGNNVSRDPGQEDFELAGEVEVIQAYPSGRLNVFEFEGAANDDVRYANQGIPRKLLTGSFTIPHYNSEMTEAERDAFQILALGCANCINSAIFKGFAIGQVKFDGISGGSYRNENGDRRWAFNCHFSFKILKTDLAGGAIASNDWLYMVNEQEGVYRKVINHDTTEYLYATADFAPLVTAPP